MCIIAAKPRGVEMPSEKYIDNMFINNPDGAGIMYAVDGKVKIEKGLMNRIVFWDKLDELDEKYGLKELPIVMHFRITTHGGTKPENCHPFPITDSMGMLKKLKTTTDIGVAHNGIISVTPRNKNISDTMEYIAGQLAPLKRAVPYFYKSKDLMEMIYHAIDSKMVFMDGAGKMYFVGDFWEEGEVKYSNTSYKKGMLYRNVPYSSTAIDTGWNDDPWYYEGEVMWLDDSKGEYVRTHENKMEQGDFAIDEIGNVYYFDLDVGMLVLCPNFTPHDANGNWLMFNEESPLITNELIGVF